MDEITINFSNPLQVSVQIGDTAYYTNDAMGENITTIGLITAMSSSSITCSIPSTTVRPTTSSFILFSKNTIANTSGLLGYFAEVELINDSIKKAELFSVGCEIFESSK